MDENQNIMISASPFNVILVNNTDPENPVEEDIDDVYGISRTESVVYDYESQSFYLVNNVMQEKLGLYILKLSKYNIKESRFILK